MHADRLGILPDFISDTRGGMYMFFSFRVYFQGHGTKNTDFPRLFRPENGQ